MFKIHGKSVLLGVGIGIILTAILGLIFTLGYTPEMDEVKVRELARKYGMVDQAQIKGSREPLILEVTQTDTLTTVTEKLIGMGLVKDALSFQIKLANQQAKDKMVPGVYELIGTENEQEIIDRLTKNSK